MLAGLWFESWLGHPMTEKLTIKVNRVLKDSAECGVSPVSALTLASVSRR